MCCGCSRNVNAVFGNCYCRESAGPSELGVMGQSPHRYVVLCKVMYDDVWFAPIGAGPCQCSGAVAGG